jgi:hypothetical protein
MSTLIHPQTSAFRAEESSVIDPVGRVIHYDGRILRGIREAYVDEARRIMEIAHEENWFAHGLVPSWLTPYELESYPLVIEHARIPFVTLRGEWPAPALRQAALTYLDLAITLARSGFCLKDAHTWNVLFDGTRPMVTDFGSIRPLAELHWGHWLTEFRKYFLVPLLLFAEGRSGLARSLCREHARGVGNWLIDHDITHLVSHPAVAFPPEPFDPQTTFETLRRTVEELTFTAESGEWTGYAQPTSGGDEVLREKDVRIREILDRLEFSTAIDLGANRGLHAFMCAARGAAVLACDIDETSLNDAYERARKRHAQVTPLYLDLVWPQGSGGAFGTVRSAHDRLRAELVLALAIVHHISLRQRFDPEALLAGICGFTSKSAIIEFIPTDDWHVAQWNVPSLPGYSIEGFHEALASKFASVTIVPSDPAPRQLFICEGKY